MLTFDHEHVPNELLEKLIADGVCVHRRRQAWCQVKLVMRQRLAAAGVAVPLREIKIDVFDRTCRRPDRGQGGARGYDGRGVPDGT